MKDENDKVIDIGLPSVVPGNKGVLNPEQLMERAIARAEIVEKMRELAIKHTKPTDWIDYNGKPGLDGPGSERVARTLGLVACDCVGSTEELPNGSGYIVYINGKMGFPGGEFIEVTGSCCSTKPFFTAKEGPVNPGDIHKNALTNFYVNGVTRFVGLRGLTWEEVEKISDSKITRDKAQKIDYKGSKPIEREDEEKAKLKMIWEWLLEMNVGAVAEAKKQLQALTAFDNFKGYNNIDKVSSKVLVHLYPKIEKIYNSWGDSAKKAESTSTKQTNTKKQMSMGDK